MQQIRTGVHLLQKHRNGDSNYKSAIDWSFGGKTALTNLFRSASQGVMSYFAEKYAGEYNNEIDLPRHLNGAVGIAGWRGARAKNVPKDLPGQINKMMTEIFTPSDGDSWHHGGEGTGVRRGEDMRQLFLNTLNTPLATKAFMKGYVRPEEDEHLRRLNLSDLMRNYMM